MICEFRSVLFVSVFQGLLFVIVIMIDGSEKRNYEGGFWTLQFRVRVFVKSAVKHLKLIFTCRFRVFIVFQCIIILLMTHLKQSSLSRFCFNMFLLSELFIAQAQKLTETSEITLTEMFLCLIYDCVLITLYRKRFYVWSAKFSSSLYREHRYIEDRYFRPTLSQNLIASQLLGFLLYPFPFFLTAVSLLYT